MESLEEICQYLNPDTRLDLKAIALEHVLSITGTTEGRELLLKLPNLLTQLIALMQDSSTAISKDAALALINITGDETGANAFVLISEISKESDDSKYNYNLIHVCISYTFNMIPKNEKHTYQQHNTYISLKIRTALTGMKMQLGQKRPEERSKVKETNTFIMDKESTLADPCCMILSNVTRPLHLVDRITTLIEKSGYTWDSIVNAFTTKQYNNTGAKLHYLGPVFSNLSQSPQVRRYLMDRDRSVIQRLLPFTEYADSIIRRGGIVGTLKNCCFDVDNHEWLLSPEVDILSYLLLPLAGPEELDDEDNDKLPISLQYLPETKEREPDVDIRIILLEALAQLCATKRGREILREQNTYVILREYHKWEKNKNALLACENVVDILIRTEEEIGMDNLKDVEVPSEYTEKFRQMDQEFINST